MSVISRFLSPSSDDAPDAVSIEPLRRRHLRAVLGIERQVYPKPWTLGVFKSELDMARSGERYYVAALAGETLLGYAGLLFTPDEAHVTNIAVDPIRQRRGVGRRLMLDLAWEARARRRQALTLEVRVTNVEAQEMYRTFGFVPAGVRTRYYENSVDALIMWAHDIHTDDYARRLHDLEARAATP